MLIAVAATVMGALANNESFRWGIKAVHPRSMGWTATLHVCSSVSVVGLAKYEQTRGSFLMVMKERLITCYQGVAGPLNGIKVGVGCIICCMWE